MGCGEHERVLAELRNGCERREGREKFLGLVSVVGRQKGLSYKGLTIEADWNYARNSCRYPDL